MGRVLSALVATVVLATAACTAESNSDSITLDEPVLSNGTLPRPAPDEPLVIQAEDQGPLQIGVINNKVVTVSDDSTFRFAVSVVDESGRLTEVNTDGALVVEPEHRISVVGNGLRPYSRAVAWIFSTPRRLGEVQVADDGSFNEQFALPAGLPAGRHTTQVNAIDADGDVRSFNLALMVQSGAVALTTTVPSTTTSTTVRPTTTTTSTTVRPAATKRRTSTTSSTTTTSSSVPTATTTSTTVPTTVPTTTTTTSTTVPTTTTTTTTTTTSTTTTTTTTTVPTTTTTTSTTTTTTSTTTTTVAPAVYTVTYNGNSESSGTVPSDSNSYTVSGNVTVAGNTGTLSKTGHTFDGWCTTQPAAGAACTGTPRAVGSTFSIVADTTLYAVWALNSQTISYAAGTGGSGSAPSSPTSVAYGSTFTTPANTYSRTGHTFAGWSDGSSTYAAGATYPASGTVSGNVTLTATWTANSQTISYAAGTGGSGSAPSSPTSVSYGGTFTTPANTYSRTGHTFAGWSDGSSTYAAGATYPASGTVSGNVTLTATWAASCAQGGTCVVGDTGPGGGKVFYVAAGTFACGPALASTCKYLEAAPTTGTNAWTDNIYAWSGNTTTEIGAAAQGTSIGTGYRNTEAMVAQSSTAERAGTITRAYRGPNNLTDWYLPSRDELNELYTQRTSLGIASTGEYWSSTEPFSATSARYIWFFNGTQLTTAKSTSLIVRPIRAFGLPPFSVTYNGNTHGSGSVPTDSSTYSFNASVTVASNSGSLAKSGYTFGGWCTTQPAAGSACSGTSRAAGSTFSITSNVTLYAVWTTLTCAQGGTCVVGDTGPGGGVVFYVAGSNFTSTGSDCGTTCRYLEAAPSDQSTGTQWCSNNSTTLFVTAAAIGTGMANTNTARETCASGAIHIAADYSNAAAIDWHLPSRLELNELCKYARQQTTGDTSVSCNNSGSLRAGFASSSYWSSSENSGTRSWSRSFGDGVQGDNPKTSTYRVRPIRAF